MAQKEIVWTQYAIDEFRKILEFYTERNQNTNYPSFLLNQIDKRIQIISFYPNIGHSTQIKEFRLFPYKDFGIIYKTTYDTIYIESIWHFKQNPKKRKDNKK